jgi:hypothetical protein
VIESSDRGIIVPGFPFPRELPQLRAPESAAQHPAQAQFLFVGGVPGRIFVKRCHCTRERGSVRAKILRIHNVVVGDDEGHHTRRPIMRRRGLNSPTRGAFEDWLMEYRKRLAKVIQEETTITRNGVENRRP